MIQSCICNKRFVFSDLPEGQERSNSCRNCGGILSVEGLGSLSGRMWSATESEISRVIDPQLKWKISSNCKHRALRRARTCKQDNGKKSSVQDLKDTEELFDKASSRGGAMFVSESEKFGVNLLGRRFSENLESFPIKKRIISLLPSQSASHVLSSSSFHDHNQASYIPSFQNNKDSLQQDDNDVNPSHEDHEKCSPNERTSLTYIDKHIDDSVDFSGISILAAAACHSSIEKGLVDSDATVSSHSFEKSTNSLSCIEPHKDKDQLSNPELGIDKPEHSMVHFTILNTHDEEPGPMESFTTLNKHYEEPGPVGSDECKIEHSGSLHNSPNRRKLESSRDDRRNWDLNTVMDVWESLSDDYSKCDTPSEVRSSCHDMVCGNEEPCSIGSGAGIKGVSITASGKASISYSSCKLEEEMEEKHVADCDEGKHVLIQTQVHQHLQGKCQFKDSKVVPDVSLGTNPQGNVENSRLISMTSYPVEGISNLASNLSAKRFDLCEEDKIGNGCARLSMKEDTYSSVPCPVIIGNPSLNMDVFDTFAEDKRANETLHDKSKSKTAVDINVNYSGECLTAYGKKGKSNQLSRPDIEKHQFLCTDVACNVTTQTSIGKQLNRNAYLTLTTCDNEKQCRSSSTSTKAEGCLLDEVLPSTNACIRHCEDISTDVEMDESKSSILTCDILNYANSSSPFHTYTEIMDTVAVGPTLDSMNKPAELVSYGEHQAPVAANAENLEKHSPEELFHHEHHLNASLIDTDHASRLEKVDLLGDDDSQYEDGELRESILNSWGEDGVEEVETERVDYGSDCREADSLDAESDFCSQSDLVVGSTECKHEVRPITSCDGNILLFSEDPQSKCSQTQFSVKDFSNVRYGEGDVKVDMLKDSGKVIDLNLDGDVPASAEDRIFESHVSNGTGDFSGKATQPSSSRLKSSGWDKLPRNVDAAIPRLTNDTSVASVINGESARTVSLIKREFSSSIELSKSSEPSCRKVVSYDRENRKNDHFDLHAQRSVDVSRLDGRSRVFHSHGRGRVWVDPPDHHSSCRIASGYYSSPKLPNPGSRNAAAAAVAKVESNGFVVAPDGTIVKSGNLGPGTHLSGHSSMSSSHFHSKRRGSPMESDGEFSMSSELNSYREVSPGRCFNPGRGRATKYGSRLCSLGHGNRYHSAMPDSRIGSQPLQHPSSRRQRSFSPRRKPVIVSHEFSRSPSRSRTRSPRTWISPRGRNDGRINDVTDLKRHSRSPTNFKPQRRILRQRSPLHRDFPSEEFAAYGPPSRNHSSPPHPSRWFDSDRICRDHLHERQSRRPSERSPRTRNFSQSNGLHNMDSHGRIKPGEYYEPIYSGDYPVYGREPKHDDCGDGRRGRSSKYEMFHHDGNLRTSTSMNCIRYDDEIRSHNFRPKSLVFQRRQNLRTFDRSFNAQNEDSPQRIKGEMVHFRDAKSNSDFQPFKFRDTGDELCLQRRPT